MGGASLAAGTQPGGVSIILGSAEAGLGERGAGRREVSETVFAATNREKWYGCMEGRQRELNRVVHA